jgi:hypothetical protein
MTDAQFRFNQCNSFREEENIWNHLHALEVNLHMLAADKCETCVHASQTCVHATLPLLF